MCKSLALYVFLVPWQKETLEHVGNHRWLCKVEKPKAAKKEEPAKDGFLAKSNVKTHCVGFKPWKQGTCLQCRRMFWMVWSKLQVEKAKKTDKAKAQVPQKWFYFARFSTICWAFVHGKHCTSQLGNKQRLERTPGLACSSGSRRLVKPQRRPWRQFHGHILSHVCHYLGSVTQWESVRYGEIALKCLPKVADSAFCASTASLGV